VEKERKEKIREKNGKLRSKPFPPQCPKAEKNISASEESTTAKQIISKSRGEGKRCKKKKKSLGGCYPKKCTLFLKEQRGKTWPDGGWKLEGWNQIIFSKEQVWTTKPVGTTCRLPKKNGKTNQKDLCFKHWPRNAECFSATQSQTVKNGKNHPFGGENWKEKGTHGEKSLREA